MTALALVTAFLCASAVGVAVFLALRSRPPEAGLSLLQQQLESLRAQTAEALSSQSRLVAQQVEAVARAVNEAKRHGLPVLLLVNKIDRVRKPKLLPYLQGLGAMHEFVTIIPVSAKTGDGIEIFISELAKLMKEGPRQFPDDQVTDLTERKAASELVREHVQWALAQRG